MSVPVGPLLIVILLSWCALSTRLLYCFRLEHMDGDLVQRSKAIGFCYINSTMVSSSTPVVNLQRMLTYSLSSLKRTWPAVQLLPGRLPWTNVYFSLCQFFFMYANLNKSPAYGMSTELTMPTYNKVFKLLFFLWTLTPFSFGQLEDYCCLPDVCCLFIMHILLRIKVRIWTKPVPVVLRRITMLYIPSLWLLFQIHI